MINSQAKLDFSSQSVIMQKHLNTWRILKQYDENFISEVSPVNEELEPLFSIDEARTAINNFCQMLESNKLASEFFGKEKMVPYRLS